MLKYGLIGVLLLAASLQATAQIKTTSLQTDHPAQYTLSEWNITLQADWNNPYLQEEVALDMHLTSPSGKSLVLPCYYDSGRSGALSLWKARFTPQEAGNYSYTFQLHQSGKAVSTSASKTFLVNPSDKKGFLHPRSHWVFQFDNGTPFRGIGENIGWESRTVDDSKYFKALHEESKYDYAYMLPSLASHGGNFFRTWMCRWNLPIDWKDHFNNRRYQASDAYYNPSAVKRMDWMIRLADSLGLHIMLTLGPGAYGERDGGFAKSAADFFVNPRSDARYKNRLRYIIARWGYSPAIAAWELFNEVDNVMYRNPDKPINAASIVRWHDRMSAYIKQIDPYHHMVTTSISHRDLPGLDTLHHIDINQKHIYRNTVGIPSTIVDYEHRFHKPYVIGEFSYEWDWSKNFNDFKDGMISDYKRGLWYGLFSPTPILPMSWWWEYFDSLGTDGYMSRVRTISDKMLAAGHGQFDSLSVASAPEGLQTFAVQCGKTRFVYAYNPGEKPQTGEILIASPAAIQGKTLWYDCESGQYQQTGKITSKGGNIHIPCELPAGTDRIWIIP